MEVEGFKDEYGGRCSKDLEIESERESEIQL